MPKSRPLPRDHRTAGGRVTRDQTVGDPGGNRQARRLAAATPGGRLVAAARAVDQAWDRWVGHSPDEGLEVAAELGAAVAELRAALAAIDPRGVAS